MWVLKHILNVRRGKYSFLMAGVAEAVLMIGCLTEHINSAADSCQEQLHNSHETSLYQSKSIASTASFKLYLFSKRQCLSSSTCKWHINISMNEHLFSQNNQNFNCRMHLRFKKIVFKGTFSKHQVKINVF